jgi:hypothetical protein
MNLFAAWRRWRKILRGGTPKGARSECGCFGEGICCEARRAGIGEGGKNALSHSFASARPARTAKNGVAGRWIKKNIKNSFDTLLHVPYSPHRLRAVKETIEVTLRLFENGKMMGVFFLSSRASG